MDRLCKAPTRTAQIVLVSRYEDFGFNANQFGSGWEIRRVQQVRDLERLVRASSPMAGVLDLQAPYTDAELSQLEQALQHLHVMWVAITSTAMLEDERIRRLIRDYCVDYVRTPFSFDELLYTLKHAHGMACLHGARSPELVARGPMIGECAPMRNMFRSLAKVAHNDAPVFISGESGTGKELAAQAIHEASSRRKGPFVAINCGAIPSHLVQSELFGYEKGAFTGAQARKPGLVETAEGGTLFLDEMGDVPLAMQVKLLRLIESGTYRRVGGVETLQSNFRLVAATHKPLEQMVAQGLFRQDLYFRIAAFPIHLPSLRERLDDIALLAESILARGNRSKDPLRLSPEALARMRAHHWPGNIRELRNVLERARLYADDGVIRVKDLPPGMGEARVSSVRFVPPSAYRTQAPRQDDDEALRFHASHFTGTRRALAQSLGMSERTLYRRLKALGIE
ncbi:MAG TPA: Fis family transcriptional regulator [Cupriavidus sp.]|nr:Fis family transcriptional regulator [Cupriavidus sp.]